MVRFRYLAVFFAALFCLSVPAAQAKDVLAKDKADIYFGYSRTGRNLYAVYTPGMNGWQAAAHFRPIPFVGIEGDISHYSETDGGYSQDVTLVMFGPRVTAHAAGFSVFAHGLLGVADQHSKLAFYPGVAYNATSYALGGGADIPVVLGLKLRVTGDYLGNSKAPSAEYSPSHYRIGTGLAYHF